MHEIEGGMALKKCRKCGCMQEALDGAERAFHASEDPEIRALASVIRDFKGRMEPLAYDCIGCKKCWGADATIQLTERFETIQPDSCGAGSLPSPAQAPVVRLPHSSQVAWPPYAGDYLVGNPNASVAVCTLSSRDLPAAILEAGHHHVAITGRCDTENIGVEKVVLNILADPAIRWLVLCGIEAQGHRTGNAFLHLKARGVDANMRVLESASWRPILKNLTLADVARFREQIEVIDLIGNTDVPTILKALQECAAKPVVPLPIAGQHPLPTFERIRARAPERLKLDRAGFFIVLPQPQTGLILCEHYENNGRLAHVIEGRQAALIAATVVERGLITQLDHAVYLGRELAKAELALKTGATYEQDAALGNVPSQDARMERSSGPVTKPLMRPPAPAIKI
jgi:tetrahydromethanopterin S-methyltransferase subunit A